MNTGTQYGKATGNMTSGKDDKLKFTLQMRCPEFCCAFFAVVVSVCLLVFKVKQTKTSDIKPTVKVHGCQDQ